MRPANDRAHRGRSRYRPAGSDALPPDYRFARQNVAELTIELATRRSRRLVRLAPCRTIGIARAVRLGAGARVAASVRTG
jgi:hypothetical protein